MQRRSLSVPCLLMLAVLAATLDLGNLKARGAGASSSTVEGTQSSSTGPSDATVYPDESSGHGSNTEDATGTPSICVSSDQQGESACTEDGGARARSQPAEAYALVEAQPALCAEDSAAAARTDSASDSAASVRDDVDSGACAVASPASGPGRGQPTQPALQGSCDGCQDGQPKPVGSAPDGPLDAVAAPIAPVPPSPAAAALAAAQTNITAGASGNTSSPDTVASAAVPTPSSAATVGHAQDPSQQPVHRPQQQGLSVPPQQGPTQPDSPQAQSVTVPAPPAPPSLQAPSSPSPSSAQSAPSAPSAPTVAPTPVTPTPASPPTSTPVGAHTQPPTATTTQQAHTAAPSPTMEHRKRSTHTAIPKPDEFVMSMPAPELSVGSVLGADPGAASGQSATQLGPLGEDVFVTDEYGLDETDGRLIGSLAANGAGQETGAGGHGVTSGAATAGVASPAGSGIPGVMRSDLDYDDEEDGRKINLAASSDGASIVAANKESKRPDRLIDGDDDSYMKNACSASKWVIVELSQLGRVDEVKLTMKEMYSSRVREFSIKGRQSHPKKDGLPDYARGLELDNWQLLGSFLAENRKGSQVFRLPRKARIRYLLLQVLSHYGSEEMCALNSLEVRGVTAAQELEAALSRPLSASPAVATVAAGAAVPRGAPQRPVGAAAATAAPPGQEAIPLPPVQPTGQADGSVPGGAGVPVQDGGQEQHEPQILGMGSAEPPTIGTDSAVAGASEAARAAGAGENSLADSLSPPGVAAGESARGAEAGAALGQSGAGEASGQLASAPVETASAAPAPGNVAGTCGPAQHTAHYEGAVAPNAADGAATAAPQQAADPGVSSPDVPGGPALPQTLSPAASGSAEAGHQGGPTSPPSRGEAERGTSGASEANDERLAQLPVAGIGEPSCQVKLAPGAVAIEDAASPVAAADTPQCEGGPQAAHPGKDVPEEEPSASRRAPEEQVPANLSSSTTGSAAGGSPHPCTGGAPPAGGPINASVVVASLSSPSSPGACDTRPEAITTAPPAEQHPAAPSGANASSVHQAPPSVNAGDGQPAGSDRTLLESTGLKSAAPSPAQPGVEEAHAPSISVQGDSGKQEGCGGSGVAAAAPAPAATAAAAAVPTAPAQDTLGTTTSSGAETPSPSVSGSSGTAGSVQPTASVLQQGANGATATPVPTAAPPASGSPALASPPAITDPAVGVTGSAPGGSSPPSQVVSTTGAAAGAASQPSGDKGREHTSSTNTASQVQPPAGGPPSSSSNHSAGPSPAGQVHAPNGAAVNGNAGPSSTNPSATAAPSPSVAPAASPAPTTAPSPSTPAAAPTPSLDSLLSVLDAGAASKPRLAGNLFDVVKQEMMMMKLNQTRLWAYIHALVDALNARHAELEADAQAVEDKIILLEATLATVTAQAVARAKEVSVAPLAEINSRLDELEARAERAEAFVPAILLYSSAVLGVAVIAGLAGGRWRVMQWLVGLLGVANGMAGLALHCGWMQEPLVGCSKEAAGSAARLIAQAASEMLRWRR